MRRSEDVGKGVSYQRVMGKPSTDFSSEAP
jgi:hypothetical protein